MRLSNSGRLFARASWRCDQPALFAGITNIGPPRRRAVFRQRRVADAVPGLARALPRTRCQAGTRAWMAVVSLLHEHPVASVEAAMVCGDGSRYRRFRCDRFAVTSTDSAPRVRCWTLQCGRIFQSKALSPSTSGRGRLPRGRRVMCNALVEHHCERCVLPRCSATTAGP